MQTLEVPTGLRGRSRAVNQGARGGCGRAHRGGRLPFEDDRAGWAPSSFLLIRLHQAEIQELVIMKGGFFFLEIQFVFKGHSMGPSKSW